MNNSMNENTKKYAPRGVSHKVIALRLPAAIHQQALVLAKQQGVSLNLHATRAYLHGIAALNQTSKASACPELSRRVTDAPNVGNTAFFIDSKIKSSSDMKK